MKDLNLNELENINGGFDWRDVAVGGGAALGGTIGALAGGAPATIGTIAGGAIGGAVYDFLT